MFVYGKIEKSKPHKRRRTRYARSNLALPRLGGLARVGAYARGGGTVPLSLTERVFVWAKRLTHFPRFRAKFWVNLQAAVTLTRKGANMRMGKGKGKGGRLRSRVRPLTWLVAFAALRPGLLRRLRRFMVPRYSFKVGFLSIAPGRGRVTPWVLNSPVARFYARKQLVIAQENIDHIRRKLLISFYRKLFVWHGLVPHAVVVRPRVVSAWAFRSRGLASKRILMLAWPQATGFVRQVKSWRRYRRWWAKRRLTSPSLLWGRLHWRWTRRVYNKADAVLRPYRELGVGFFFTNQAAAATSAVALVRAYHYVAKQPLPQWLRPSTLPLEQLKQLVLKFLATLWSYRAGRRQLPRLGRVLFRRNLARAVVREALPWRAFLRRRR